MFEYNICTVFDEDVFMKQCAAIERHIPGLQKKELISDVDGTQIQTYLLKDKEIIVLNDAGLGVLVRSPDDITPYFKIKD